MNNHIERNGIKQSFIKVRQLNGVFQSTVFQTAEAHKYRIVYIYNIIYLSIHIQQREIGKERNQKDII